MGFVGRPAAGNRHAQPHRAGGPEPYSRNLADDVEFDAGNVGDDHLGCATGKRAGGGEHAHRRERRASG